MTDRTCVVTGGAGFIGSRIARALAERGDAVRILDDMSTGRALNLEDLPDAVDVTEGDVRDRAVLDRVLAGADVVFHQAARPSVVRSLAEPEVTHDVNTGGAIAVLLAARDAGARRVLLAGSSSVYGDDGELPRTEDMPPRPMSPYAASKAAAEAWWLAAASSFDLEPCVLRYFNVYGPNQDPHGEYAAVIPKFLGALDAGEPLPIRGDGEQTRDFTYVGDVVRANLAAADAPAERVTARIFNVARGEPITVNRLAEEVCRAAGSDLETVTVDPLPGEVRHSRGDGGALREALDAWPETSLEEGLARTVPGFRRLNREPA